MTRGRETRFVFRVAVIAALAVFLAAPAVQAGEDRGALPRFMETTDTTPITVCINGHTFVIPLNYFRYPPKRDGVDDDGFYLRVLLPKLLPYTADTADEFRRGGHGRKLQILMELRRSHQALEDLFHTYLQFAEPVPPSDESYGLTYGPARGLYRSFGDVYAFEREGTISPLMICRSIRPNYSASCSHIFFWRDAFVVRLTYGREHLPQWRAIQQRVIEQLEAFLQNNNSHSACNLNPDSPLSGDC